MSKQIFDCFHKMYMGGSTVLLFDHFTTKTGSLPMFYSSHDISHAFYLYIMQPVKCDYKRPLNTIPPNENPCIERLSWCSEETEIQ